MTSFDNVSFPLPQEKVPQISLSDQDVKQYRALAHDIVHKTVEQDFAYRHIYNEKLDERKWKYVKSKGDLRSYKRLSKDSGSPAEKYVLVPMIVVVGTIEGTIENSLYGIHNKTTEEIRIMASHTNKNLLDTALLATLESGADNDPYRFLGLKWRVAQTPGGSLIKNRDVTNLEYMGIDVDSHGEKFGFHMLKSVDVPGFPAFTNSDVIRAKMMLCCIFRQIAPNVVGCYCKGVFNLGGALIDIIAYNTASDTVLAMAKAMDIATTKRLTLLLMRNDTNLKNRHHSRLFSRSSATSIDSLDMLEMHDDLCALCSRKSSLSMLGLSFHACTICGRRTCHKCYVKHAVLARPKNIKVICCLSCVIEAKNMAVDPRDTYPILNGV